MYDCLILGSGPAGLSAAVYAQRARISALVIEKVYRGAGQITESERVDNYLGMYGENGYSMGVKFRKHADELGAEFYEGKVTAITKKSDENGIYYSVSLDDGKSFEGRTVIYALGTERRKLNVKGEAEYTGKGVSYCAVCDGAFYRKKTTAVAGGGDTALGDALLLSKFAQKVYIIHRRNELRANKALQEKVKALPNVEFILNADITEIKGEKKVAAVKIIKKKKKKEIPVDLPQAMYEQKNCVRLSPQPQTVQTACFPQKNISDSLVRLNLNNIRHSCLHLTER